MPTGAITAYADVAQLVLYAFWLFFAGLVYYLVRENHREGYPMETETGRGTVTGWPIPPTKTYLLQSGETVNVPNGVPERTLAAEPAYGWTGAPLVPTGNPMTDGIGPGSYAMRHDVPDLTFEGTPKVIPLGKADGYDVYAGDTDPRGLPVLGGDGEKGGTVVDLWIDVSENLFRYLEVDVAGGRRVLLPMNFARVKKDAVHVGAIFGEHFAGVPGTKQSDVVTMLEEERIQAYYGAGTLYAEPSRAEPLL